jgi:hypothetical protein
LCALVYGRNGKRRATFSKHTYNALVELAFRLHIKQRKNELGRGKRRKGRGLFGKHIEEWRGNLVFLGHTCKLH